MPIGVEVLKIKIMIKVIRVFKVFQLTQMNFIKKQAGAELCQAKHSLASYPLAKQLVLAISLC